MNAHELEQAVAAEMRTQRADALAAYRKLLHVKEHSAKDRTALIEAMRTLGKQPADLRNDLDAVAAFPQHQLTVERWNSPEYAEEVKAARNAYREFQEETSRILNERNVTEGKLQIAMEKLEGLTREAHEAKSQIARLSTQFAEVLGLE